MKVKICLMGLLCLFLRVSAQQILTVNQPLKTGDAVPDIELHNVINYPNPVIRLSGFRGKVLILDFWATWCTSCLQHFPAMDSLQKQFGNRVQIILVDTRSTRDNKEKVETTFSRLKKQTGDSFSLLTIYGDTILDKLFKHYILPNVVWIDQNGVFRANTGAEELTAENLNAFIRKAQAPRYLKQDFDPHRPLYTDPALPLNDLEQYSILVKGKKDGIEQGGLRRINDTVRGFIAHDQSLEWILRIICFNKIPQITGNRLVLDVKDPSKLHYVPGQLSKTQWERVNDYSYELIVPKNKIDQLYDFAMADLNRYTNYRVSIENRPELCWVLSKTKGASIPVDHSGKYVNQLESDTDACLSGAPMFSLCEFINKISDCDQIVLDETGFKPNISLDFKQPVHDIATLRHLLLSYGLVLRHQTRSIPMMIVQDNPSLTSN